MLDQHERGIVRSGVSAVAELGIDLVAPGVAELYADEAGAEGLARQHALKESRDPNVILNVVGVPEALEVRLPMPLGVAVVDLLESGEPRAVAAARRHGVRGRARPDPQQRGPRRGLPMSPGEVRVK